MSTCGVEVVLAALEKVRVVLSSSGNEQLEEAVLEAMDVMTGYVSPHMMVIPKPASCPRCGNALAANVCVGEVVTTGGLGCRIVSLHHAFSREKK